jgi:DNA-binding XRE family transcriptional regulator
MTHQPSWSHDRADPATILRGWRERLGLSRHQLAADVGLDDKTLYGIEKAGSLPYLSTVKTLDRYLIQKAGPLGYQAGDLLKSRSAAAADRAARRVGATSDRRAVTTTYLGRGARIRREYDTLLASRVDSVDLLGCGLRQVREDYGQRLEEILRRIKARMLLSDPCVPTPARSYARQRESEEGVEAEGICRDVLAWAVVLRQLPPDLRPRLHIRLYHTMPALNIIRIGNVMLWGPYLVGDVSRNMPTLRTSSGNELFTVLQTHFEKLWSPACSRSLPSLSRLRQELDSR